MEKRDGIKAYFNYKPGEKPTMTDHMDALSLFVKPNMSLAIEAILDEGDDSFSPKYRQAVSVLWSAMKTWKEIDKIMSEDSKEVNAESVIAAT